MDFLSFFSNREARLYRWIEKRWFESSAEYLSFEVSHDRYSMMGGKGIYVCRSFDADVLSDILFSQVKDCDKTLEDYVLLEIDPVIAGIDAKDVAPDLQHEEPYTPLIFKVMKDFVLHKSEINVLSDFEPTEQHMLANHYEDLVGYNSRYRTAEICGFENLDVTRNIIWTDF